MRRGLYGWVEPFWRIKRTFPLSESSFFSVFRAARCTVSGTMPVRHRQHDVVGLAPLACSSGVVDSRSAETPVVGEFVPGVLAPPALTALCPVLA